MAVEKSMGLPVLEEEEVKEALALLQKHKSSLDERCLTMVTPLGTTNRKLNDMLRKKILGEAKILRKRLGET